MEDEQRDDDCVVVENTQDHVQINNNTFHVQDEVIYLIFNGDYFKFIDVPGDGDCFYHSVLNYDSLHRRFNGVLELRQYMRNVVEYMYYNDHVLQYLFSKERTDLTLWCSTIIRMGEWATSFDSLILSYIFKLNVIGLRNHSNGLWGNSNQNFMHQLRLPDIFPEFPAIYVLNHQLGSPLEVANNCNHFGYLKPISLATNENFSQRLPIIFQKELKSSQLSPEFTPTLLNTSIRSTASIELETSTQPNTISEPNQMHISALPTLSIPSTLPTDDILQVAPNLCKTINRTEVLDQCLT